jgi:pimeloyl-ACP methyl ester carboxylesterase
LAKDGFQVFAPCQRGYAASTRPKRPGGYTFTQFTEDAVGIADSLRLKRFDVAGFGMGGAQAWMLTTSQPARIRSLTSIRFPHPAAFAHGIQFEPGQKEKWRRLEQDLGAGGPEERAAMMLADDAAGLRHFLAAIGLPQPFLDGYVARLQEPGALIGALSWEHAVSSAEFSRVPSVTVPTLLLWSEGPALSRTTVEATKDYVDAPYQELVIPNAGNFLLETCSSSLIAPLRQHLQST